MRHGTSTESDEQHGPVVGELLVRYLDTWTPAALHGAKRVTYAGTGADGVAVAAMHVFGEFGDRLGAGHRLAMVIAAPTPESARALAMRLEAVHAGLAAPPELTFHVGATELVTLLHERDAFGAPIFAYLDGTAIPPEDGTLTELAANRDTELLLALDPATAQATAAGLVDRYRRLLTDAGLPELVHVELVDGGDRGRLLIFATAQGKHVEKFKDELWAVDEYAGVRYRDPRDETQTLLDISLAPDVGPLRRTILQRLAEAGPRTVADLRRFAMAETLYRAGDVTRLLTPLLTTGVLTRNPEKGRLTPQTLIEAVR